MLGLQHVVTLDIRLQHIAVAPPRGVRGLKCFDFPAIRGPLSSFRTRFLNQSYLGYAAH